MNEPVQAQQICNRAEITETAPASRFTVNANQTVVDTATGLMWKQCAQGQSGSNCSGTVTGLNWQQALQILKNYNPLLNVRVRGLPLIFRSFQIRLIRVFGRPRRIPALRVARGMFRSVMVSLTAIVAATVKVFV